MTSRKAAQTSAIVALLQSLPDDQLHDVLSSLGTKGAVVLEVPHARPARPCGVCGLSYPQCRRRWSADHEYEAPEPREDPVLCPGCGDSKPCPRTRVVGEVCAHPHHENGPTE